MRLVALLALLAASASAQKRAPSASKIAATKMWLRRPGDGMRVELISKSRLPQVCKEHDLDLEAMLAVASGDADDCEGWTCGEASDYGGEAAGAAADEPAAEAKLPTPKPKAAAAKAKAAKAAAASDDDDDDGPVKLAPKDVKGAAAPPDPAEAMGAMKLPMVKLVAQFAGPSVGMRFLKQFGDEKSPEFVAKLRLVFYAACALHVVVDLLLRWRIAAANQTEMVEMPANPLSMLLGGGAKPQTAREYDEAQLAKLRNSARVGVLVVSFLHFKFKWNKALLHNACSSLVELIFHPLVQLHLLGQTVKRPFGGGGGAGLDPAMMAKMMGGGGLAPPGGAAK